MRKEQPSQPQPPQQQPLPPRQQEEEEEEDLELDDQDVEQMIDHNRTHPSEDLENEDSKQLPKYRSNRNVVSDSNSLQLNVSGSSALEKVADQPNGFAGCTPSYVANLIWTEFKKNWQAGVTVALINVPLSISLAVASDATPIMGIITSIWGGLFSASFGGSHFNIVGPTGALSGILSKYSIVYGVSILPFLAMIAGIGSFFVFAFSWDRYVMFLPSSVDQGFTV